MLENLPPKRLNCIRKDLTFDLMQFKKDWICLDTTNLRGKRLEKQS